MFSILINSVSHVFFSASSREVVEEIAIGLIDNNPDQPRKNFDKEALKTLSDSIREHGVITPIVVMKSGENYEIVAGERRWRAARMAGLTEVPVVIRELSDEDTAALALIENLQREDLGNYRHSRSRSGSGVLYFQRSAWI